MTNEPCPTGNHKRVRSGFLWLPLTIGDKTKWLVWAMWLEEFVEYYDSAEPRGAWEPCAWATKNEERD